jgi:hypothetical protein
MYLKHFAGRLGCKLINYLSKFIKVRWLFAHYIRSKLKGRGNVDLFQGATPKHDTRKLESMV